MHSTHIRLPPAHHAQSGSAQQPAGAAVTIECRRLESDPDSFFLTEAWYRACVDSWSGRARFRRLDLENENSAVVWALIGERTEVRHGVLPVRVLALNQSAIDRLDQPWIERNGFFGATPNDFEKHLVTLLDRLCSEPGWDELRIGGLVSADAHRVLYQAARRGLGSRLDLEQPSFSIDLAQIRHRHDGDYLSMLSANTRQQLRRSRRLAERELGALRLETAGSVTEAHAWLDATAPLHRARWGTPESNAYGSGFDNPAFVEFHRRLIVHAFPSGAIQYLRLRAGDITVAYLYNFVSCGHVHFYLSGIDYSVAEAYRPGMLAHWLAIERNLAEGHRIYDFLAGDARYKRSMSTSRDQTMWLVLQRPRLRLQLESFARRIKHTWVGGDANDLARLPPPSGVDTVRRRDD